MEFINKLTYEDLREEIKKAEENIIINQNEDRLNETKDSYYILSNLYEQCGLDDLSARNYYNLAIYLKSKKETKDFELCLDCSYRLYVNAIRKSENYKLQQDNNGFLLNLSEAYMSIGAYNKAFECALYSIKVYSVGFDIKRAVSILYSIEAKKDFDLDHYLYGIYGEKNIKEIKNNVSIRRGHRYYDPIEDTTSFRQAFLDSEDKIRKLLKEENGVLNSQRYYEIKKKVLLDDYGIEWDPPIDLEYA